MGGCGGGAKDQSTLTPPSVEGANSGAFTGDKPDQAVMLLVLENAEVWAFCGEQMASRLFVAGLIQGNVPHKDASVSVSKKHRMKMYET